MALKGDWSRNGNFLATFKEQIISLFHSVPKPRKQWRAFQFLLINWFTEVYNP